MSRTLAANVPLNDVFVARTLCAETVLSDAAATRRAFALASLAHPRLTYGGWVRYLKRAARPNQDRTGIMFLEDRRGYPHAMFRYAVDDRPSLVAAAAESAARILRLSDIVAADVAADSLLPEIATLAERLAGSLDCAMVMIELPGALRIGQGALVGYEEAAGGVVFRPLPRDAETAASGAAA